MYSKHYETVGELLNAPASTWNQKAAEVHWEAISSGFMSKWYGVSSKEEALRTLLGGWPEGLQRIRETMGKIELPQVASIRRRVAWKDAGDDLSLDRLYSGEMSCWRSTERQTCPPGLIPCQKIMVSVNANAGQSKKDFFWRGAAAVILADALEESGRSCEIVAYSLVRCLGEGSHVIDHFSSVTLKRSDEPLDAARIASMTAHPAALRVAFFRADFASSYKISYSHGSPVNWEDPPMPSDEPCIVIRNLFSEYETREFINQTVKGF